MFLFSTIIKLNIVTGLSPLYVATQHASLSLRIFLVYLTHHKLLPQFIWQDANVCLTLEFSLKST